MIVRQSGIMNEIYQSNDPENLSRQENIEELINGMHDFCATREEEGNEKHPVDGFSVGGFSVDRPG